MSDSSGLRIAAQSYADLGLSIIPLKAMSKFPDLSRWQQYQGRRPTDEEIADWFSRPRNIAIVCGEISGGLVGLDFDDPRAFVYCFPDYHRLSDETFVVETSRGVGHVYARMKGGGKPKSTTLKKKPGARVWLPLDVQAEGKYLVAPPSVHPSGKPYRFVGVAPRIMEVESYNALMDTMKARAEEWPFVEAVLPSWTEGTRHNLALGIAQFLRYRCVFDEARVEDVVRRICAASGDSGVEDRLRAVRDTIAKGAKETSAKTWLGEGLYDQLVALVPKRRKPAATIDGEREVAEHTKYVVDVMKKFTFATMRDTEEVYAYEQGVFRSGAEALIRAEVELALFEEEDSAKKNLVEEVVAAVQRRTYVARKDFNPAGKLCLLNGVLDIASLSVSPHAPNDRFTIQLQVSYDPAADCPRFKKFLEEILPNPTSRRTIKRLFGYCLEPGNRYQIAFMLVGEGDNGKSTLLGVLRDMLGHENVSTETFQRLSDNTFASSRLWAKLANICPDIPAKAVRETGTFKALTGGDALVGERKYRDAFDFVNPSKLIFSANELPEVNDKTFAFWRRWLLIAFTESFTGRADRELREKLRKELAGILNWSLEGMRDLREVGGFEADGAAERLKEDWKRRADSLYWFVAECIEIDANSEIPKEEFYRVYAAFCMENKARIKARDRVGGDLRNVLPFVRMERPRTEEGGREWVWAGIRLNEKGLTIQNELQTAVPPRPPGPAARQSMVEEQPGQGGPSGPGVRNSDTMREGGQHPNFMLGLERALQVRRLDPDRPVAFIVGDLTKELRAKGHEPDVDQLTAGVIKGMMREPRGGSP